jgi:hypothetical protein
MVIYVHVFFRNNDVQLQLTELAAQQTTAAHTILPALRRSAPQLVQTCVPVKPHIKNWKAVVATIREFTFV